MGVGLGRRYAEENGFYEQSYQNAKKTFVQEVVVDSLRHSDWAVTLVLMVLDLHSIAEDSDPANNHFMGTPNPNLNPQVLTCTTNPIIT